MPPEPVLFSAPLRVSSSALLTVAPPPADRLMVPPAVIPALPMVSGLWVTKTASLSATMAPVVVVPPTLVTLMLPTGLLMPVMVSGLLVLVSPMSPLPLLLALKLAIWLLPLYWAPPTVVLLR